MTSFKNMPITELINHRYSRLMAPFMFYSDILGVDVIVPPGFIFDWESIPIIRGTSKISGLVHDYLCRIDSIPVIDKRTAADVYREFLLFRGTPKWKVWLKYWVVRYAQGYFHIRLVLEDG